MRFIFWSLLFALSVCSSSRAFSDSQKIGGLYVNAYGNKSNPSIIFIHGGPGYDSQDFEFSTAIPLSVKGYYVVVYDQRGQGRSDLARSPLDYSYKQYADDLNSIIRQLGLVRPTLIGHSHGGPIALNLTSSTLGSLQK